MESVTTPFGRRPMTLGMLASQVRGRAIAPGRTADKWKLFRALCEARVKLGVTDRALALMNALLSFYPKAQLSAEEGLIVFPSNAQLSLRANGMAEATIRRHLAVLVEAGLIARRDSANGKRYARRGEEGVLSEAFGFSLAPLLARAEEIERLAADVEAERLVLQRLRELNRGVFAPDRGKPAKRACVVASACYRGFYGPFAGLAKGACGAGAADEDVWQGAESEPEHVVAVA